MVFHSKKFNSKINQTKNKKENPRSHLPKQWMMHWESIWPWKVLIVMTRMNVSIYLNDELFVTWKTMLQIFSWTSNNNNVDGWRIPQLVWMIYTGSCTISNWVKIVWSLLYGPSYLSKYYNLFPLCFSLPLFIVHFWRKLQNCVSEWMRQLRQGSVLHNFYDKELFWNLKFWIWTHCSRLLKSKVDGPRSLYSCSTNY